MCLFFNNKCIFSIYVQPSKHILFCCSLGILDYVVSTNDLKKKLSSVNFSLCLWSELKNSACDRLPRYFKLTQLNLKTCLC